MLTRSEGYVRADNLKVGQSLMPNYIPDSYQDIYDKYLRQYEVSDYWHDSDCTYQIHHIDGNHANNSTINLVRLKRSDHFKLHGILNSRNYDKYKIVLLDIIKGVYSSVVHEIYETYINNITDSTLKNVSSNIGDRNHLRSIKYKDWDKNQKKAVSSEVTSRHSKYGSVLGNHTHEELSSIHKDKVWGVHRDTITRSLIVGHNTDTAVDNHSRASVVREKSPNYVFNRLKNQVKEFYEQGVDISTPEMWDESTSNLCNVSKFSRRYSRYILRYFTWEEFLFKCREFTKYYNHKIKSIEVIELSTPEPKYDLHVPYYENFALECGVFTHNSAGTTMAGNVVYEIMKYIKKNDYYSRVILFIHDSIELDIHPDEIISIGHKIIPLMNEYPVKEFGVPSAADLTLGASLGQQLEVKEFESNEDFSEARLVVEGNEDNFNALISKLRETDAFKIVEWKDITDPKDKYNSYGDLFIPKLTMRVEMGTTSKVIKRELILCKKKNY